MIHMKEVKIGGCACVSVVLLLFAGLVACSSVSGSPLTDDVATLDILRENIPKDYRIRVRYISKDVGKQCWLHLNLYPVESSLKTLALKFGNLSTNRENITIFITMLQGLRFTIDNEELEVTMQAFKCHYRTARWSTKRYFDHVKEILTMFATTPQQFHCTPPNCRTSKTSLVKPDRQVIERALPSVVALLIIPCIAALVLILRTVLCRKMLCAWQKRDSGSRSSGTDGTEAQSDSVRQEEHSDHESLSLRDQYRVQQDIFQAEDTAV